MRVAPPRVLLPPPPTGPQSVAAHSPPLPHARRSAIAARFGHTAAIRLLAELRADVHKPANDEARPLHDAAKLGHLDTARLLLELRSDIEAREPSILDRSYWEGAPERHANCVNTIVG